MDKPESFHICDAEVYDAAEMDAFLDYIEKAIKSKINEAIPLIPQIEKEITERKDAEWRSRIKKALLDISRNRESAMAQEMQTHGSISYHSLINGAEMILGELLSEVEK